MFVHLVAGMALAATTASGTYSTHGDKRLEELIEEALQNNPRVLRAFSDYQASRHRVPQATSLPDPTVSFTQFARSIETRVGSQQRMVGISQTIPGLGKRTAGGQLASKVAGISDRLYDGVRSDVVLRVKQAYYDLGFLDRALAANRLYEELLDHFEEIARRRYAEGVGLQRDGLRLQAEITRALQQGHQLRSQRVRLEAILNALRDAPADTPIAEVSLADLPQLELEVQSLLEIGRHERPEIRAAFLSIEEAEKMLHLARIRHRPDFNVGLTWGNIRAYGVRMADLPVPGDGKDSYGVSVGLTLPVFRGKYDAGVREAAERLNAARFAYRESATAMESDVRSIAFRIETIGSQLRLHERTLVPQVEQAFESTLDAYSNGAAEVTGLLEIQRLLLDVQLGAARLRADYLKAAADLERVIGSAVPKAVPS